ncbi:protein kinase [Frigoribacterium sp. UYMn621]|uniref:serine/threonine-protein kinase n=1 Tax=Frigoribacterium sp. UYMn621 TaxID=3156343 RepID=UPI0033999365
MARPTSSPPELKGFRYLRQLGSGGFSDVYLYEQALPKRAVAVKVLDELTAENRASFAAEANLMAQLSAHPYIVSIHHADVSDDGRPFFVMEYCSGPSLADRYKRQPFTVPEALRTGVRLSSAIATAHSAGILHRDIKPANVLTNEYGWPALTDFGISSMVEDDLPTHTTTLASLAGSGSTTGSQSVGLSVPWSPPEMFEDDPKPDVRSDVFSLAATIYTLLAGRTPFEVPGKSNQVIELMGRIERGAITPMDRDDVPPRLLAVLRKGMAVDRTQRYANAVDFARALQAIELSLSYPPTQIDVPNLSQVEAPARPAGDDHADATRARGVTPVIAQPLRPSTPASDSVDRTQARGATVISPDASTAAGAPPVASQIAMFAGTPPAVAPPVADSTIVRPGGRAVVSPNAPTLVSDAGEAPRRRRRSGPILAVVGGVLVVAAVIGGVVVFAPHGTPAATKPNTTGAPLDVGTQLASAVVGTATLSADGTAATFTWTNPDPQKGDQFRWQRTDGAATNTDVTTSDVPQAVVAGIAPGTNVCIDVRILRNGALSDALSPPFCVAK